jgi:PAS domain S-box-containing protein
VLSPAANRPASDALFADVAGGEPFMGDRVVVRRDGTQVHTIVFARAILAPDGEIVGVVAASEDVSEMRRLESEAAELTEQLRLALDAGGLGTWRWDLATGVTHWDARLEALFGLAPGEFDGTFDMWARLLHPDDRDVVLTTVDEAVAKKTPYHLEHRVVWPDGSIRWLSGSGTITLDEHGEPTGSIGCTSDITERIEAQAEHDLFTEAAFEKAEHERLHRERFEFLTQVNDALSASGNVQEIMANVTRTAVPRLGDWCAIHVLPTEGGLVPDVEIAHVDPEMVAYAIELQGRFPYDPDAPTGIPNVIRTGSSEFYPEITPEVMEELDVDSEAAAIIEQLALRSAITVPLIKRGRVLGALQLVMTSSRRRYTDEDLALAEAVAARVSASIENRRLSERQNLIAKTLQASLLPDRLPDVEGVDVAVRYWAAGVGTDVGGDFYDLFQIGEESWGLVIGDVCGTGPTAAALTGLARHSLRMSAWNGNSPSEVMSWLNHAVRQTRTDSFLTAVYAEMRRRGTGFELTLASGGHPRPVVLKPDGSVMTIPTTGALLGVFDKVTCAPLDLLLEPGDTIVLYTDGVTDLAPPYGLDEEGLAALVQRSAASSAEGVADRIHDELEEICAIDDRHDDIALLVVRIGG